MVKTITNSNDKEERERKKKRKKEKKRQVGIDFEVDNDGNKILKKSSPSSIMVIFAGYRGWRSFEPFIACNLITSGVLLEQTEKMEV